MVGIVETQVDEDVEDASEGSCKGKLSGGGGGATSVLNHIKPWKSHQVKL